MSSKASAYLKEALRTRKGIKSPEAVFVGACKEERKPESAQVKSAVKDWFEWARKQRIVITMSGEIVYTPQGEAVELQVMMRQYSMQNLTPFISWRSCWDCLW
ncbi:hypothetical protein FNW02_36305 [Komarekiella sp. 'clone 1']|uniref:Uncharacterized protein n=1 Tax=Komarekiella delphini-convector SJRDD-AB1 TaxID=2593771 RepID=A0AA40VVI4_9NOST|nr:hypothetical protein [Komarekiella delphini-convector]MBD6621044.1 hypothetical protein [Komarekiella delphini-convector SJRDD-AB1]